jgi:hypothetical protein
MYKEPFTVETSTKCCCRIARLVARPGRLPEAILGAFAREHPVRKLFETKEFHPSAWK